MDFQIRPAQENDLDAINRLFAEEHAHIHHLYPRRFNKKLDKPTQKRGELIDLISDTETKEKFFVAESNDEIVGFVDLSFQKGENTNWQKKIPTVWVDDIVVTALHRRLGIASALLAQADIWAKEKKAPSVQLWVHEKNPGARKLYEQLGYKPFSAQMEKRIHIK